LSQLVLKNARERRYVPSSGAMTLEAAACRLNFFGILSHQRLDILSPVSLDQRGGFLQPLAGESQMEFSLPALAER
jgi:hypothetical protein